MWYKSLDKTQFGSYVRQDTRLNVAYWTSTKVVHMCEVQENDALLKRQISVMDTRVANLIHAVSEDLSEQKGITENLIQHQLEYTKYYCANALSYTNQQVISAQPGLAKPSKGEETTKEMLYLKARAEMIPSDDLLEEYDRAIYLLYQAADIGNADKTHDYRVHCNQRISAACDLMTPGLSRIERQCNDYIGHLYLPSAESVALIDQQIVDCSNMFSVGFLLANLYQMIFKMVEDQETEKWTSLALLRFRKDITARSKTIQSSLIEANLAQATSIGYALDPDLFPRSNIADSRPWNP